MNQLTYMYDCKRCKKKNTRESVKITEKRPHLHNTFDKNQKNPNPISKGKVEKVKREVDEAYHTEQETFVKEKTLEIEKAQLNRKERLAFGILLMKSQGGRTRKRDKSEQKA